MKWGLRAYVSCAFITAPHGFIPNALALAFSSRTRGHLGVTNFRVCNYICKQTDCAFYNNTRVVNGVLSLSLS